MRNKAKCKKCLSVIESFHATDYVECKCEEISVDGGQAMRCTAKNWENFLRFDNEGNEIVPKIIEKPIDQPDIKPTDLKFPTKAELLNMLDGMIENIEKLPQQAMTTAVNQYDHISLLILLSAIFRSDCKDES